MENALAMVDFAEGVGRVGKNRLVATARVIEIIINSIKFHPAVNKIESAFVILQHKVSRFVDGFQMQFVTPGDRAIQDDFKDIFERFIDENITASRFAHQP